MKKWDRFLHVDPASCSVAKVNSLNLVLVLWNHYDFLCKQSCSLETHMALSHCWVVRTGKRSPEWCWLKRPGREKPSKIEQRKVRGLEWEPQVEQTALLAGPIYIRQAQGQRNTWKEEPKPSSLSLSHAMGRSSRPVFGSTCPHASKMDFPAVI